MFAKKRNDLNEKSITDVNLSRNERNKKKIAQTIFKIAFVSSITLATLVGAKAGIDKVQSLSYANDFAKESQYEYLVAVDRNEATKEYKHDYKELADLLVYNLNSVGNHSKENIDLLFFQMYSNMKKHDDRNELYHMNELFSQLKTQYNNVESINQLPDNFSDYLLNSGYVNKDGINVDTKHYELDMQKTLFENKKESNNYFSTNEVDKQR